MKGQGLSLSALERAHKMLGELIPVFKAAPGTTPEASKVIAEKLDAVAELILPDDPPNHDATLSLKDNAAKLAKQLEALSATALATDYTFGDQVDAALETAKNLETAIAEAAEVTAPPPAAVADPPAATEANVGDAQAAAATAEPPAEAAATEPPPPAEAADSSQGDGTQSAEADPPASQEAAAEETPPAEAAAEEPADPPAEQQAAAEEETPAEGDPPAEEPPAEAAAEGDPPADPPAADPPMTADTVKALMKSVLDEALAGIRAEVAKVQKAISPGAMPQMPGTVPDVSLRPPPPPPAKPTNTLETLDLTQSPDLQDIDDYGRFKE